ncbi:MULTISPECIES: acyl carrier protein [Streptomyces]|uniref:Phosphopantetheine-binding protein n=1 Tax=Streptomyces fuscus TaxID=3048495 RepID=A0ABT7J0E3_9ACTN|nr:MULTISPECIES: phosphopantetheine-binding protein [Streptomyces]MCM1972459.1 phosphopantetheine-binding protein [Streptomyces sp. G1]MDL2078275.1 phosphopantetheine-binding protein [Streptomyces fuscus]SBT90024.1 Phosphopantetheine attachment site [Streptomyces sp. DI166]
MSAHADDTNADNASGDLISAVVQAVRRVIDDPVAEVGTDSLLREDLGFDSVLIMQLKYRVEQAVPELGELSLPDMVDSMTSVGSLVAYLRDRLVKAAV